MNNDGLTRDKRPLEEQWIKTQVSITERKMGTHLYKNKQTTCTHTVVTVFIWSVNDGLSCLLAFLKGYHCEAERPNNMGDSKPCTNLDLEMDQSKFDPKTYLGYCYQFAETPGQKDSSRFVTFMLTQYQCPLATPFF